MEEVTIVVMDDHPLFRQGVAGMFTLEADFTHSGSGGKRIRCPEVNSRFAPMCRSRSYSGGRLSA